MITGCLSLANKNQTMQSAFLLHFFPLQKEFCCILPHSSPALQEIWLRLHSLPGGPGNHIPCSCPGTTLSAGGLDMQGGDGREEDLSLLVGVILSVEIKQSLEEASCGAFHNRVSYYQAQHPPFFHPPILMIMEELLIQCMKSF